MHALGLGAAMASGCVLHAWDPPTVAWAQRDAADPHSLSTLHAQYRVLGQDPQAIRRALDRRSTWFDGTGERFDGGTRWSLQWRHQFETTDAGCRVEDVVFSGEIEVTTPSLKTWRLPPTKLINRWTAYQTALWTHEQHHVARVYEAVDEAVQTVVALPAAPTCAAAGIAANDAIRVVFQAMNIDQVAYDTRTDHGAAEGAFWDASP
jgi:predicted secreted Zn-dependent protease